MEKRKYERKRYDEEFRKKIVKEYYQSNLTLTGFSQLTKINVSMISRWAKKYQGIYACICSMEKKDYIASDEFNYLQKELTEIKKDVEMLKTIIRKTFSEKYKMLIEEHPEN